MFYQTRSDAIKTLKWLKEQGMGIIWSWGVISQNLWKFGEKLLNKEAKNDFEEWLKTEISIKKYEEIKNNKANDPSMKKYTKKLMELLENKMKFLQSNYRDIKYNYSINFVDTWETSPEKMEFRSNDFIISKNMVVFFDNENGDMEIQNPTIEWLFLSIYTATIEM